MVQGGMVLGTVVGQVLVSWCPVVAEVFLGGAARIHQRRMSMDLSILFNMVLLVTPVEVELFH